MGSKYHWDQWALTSESPGHKQRTHFHRTHTAHALPLPHTAHALPLHIPLSTHKSPCTLRAAGENTRCHSAFRNWAYGEPDDKDGAVDTQGAQTQGLATRSAPLRLLVALTSPTMEPSCGRSGRELRHHGLSRPKQLDGCRMRGERGGVQSPPHLLGSLLASPPPAPPPRRRTPSPLPCDRRPRPRASARSTPSM